MAANSKRNQHQHESISSSKNESLLFSCTSCKCLNKHGGKPNLQLLRLQILNNSLSALLEGRVCQKRCKFYKLLLILYPFIKLVKQIGMKRAAFYTSHHMGEVRAAREGRWLAQTKMAANID